MSKAKQKGTTGENEIVALLKAWGHGDAVRTPAGKESHDIQLGVTGLIIEVKYRKRWTIFPWVSKVRKVAKAADSEWMLFCIHGDRRSVAGKTVGRVCVMDADFAAEMLAVYRQYADPYEELKW